MDRNNGRTMQIKVYSVLQKNNVAKGGEPNERIHSQWLTHRDAQDIVNQLPGTRIEKHLATKKSRGESVNEPCGAFSEERKN
jgi:hypothetical protein